LYEQLFVAVVDEGVIVVVEMLWESDNALIHKSAFGSPLAILPMSCVVLCLDFYPNYRVTLDANNADVDLNFHNFHYHLLMEVTEDLMLLTLNLKLNFFYQNQSLL
jgi:hypothetical protein